MNRYRTVLVALITLAIAPVAAADIYKCSGPDGPVYTDLECGPDAINVEVSDSSGLVGVTDETKAELAEKKASREKSRNRVNKTTVINNQYNTINTQPAGYWARRPFWREKHPDLRPPEPVPTPLPSTVAFRRK
ncbi:MAG: hypothetical protein QNK19_10475 [Xanthomonadales bacterium]|nr:hypothetical protein [Xanthomonadales bacterium]